MNNQPREVKLKTIIELIKRRPRLTYFGALFALIPIPIIILFSAILPQLDNDVPKTDYNKINVLGTLTKGTITNIETQYNLTINNQHPSIISYKYLNNDQESESKFKTLNPDKIERLKIGDEIEIKYLENDSIIPSLEQFKFPYYMFYSVPLIFFLIGSPFLARVFIQVRREVNLYKYGRVIDAELVSMKQTAGLPISKLGQGVTVHYQYKTTLNQGQLGESFTTDMSIINVYKQGDPIKIFVSPDNESNSCLIPRLETIRNNWKID